MKISPQLSKWIFKLLFLLVLITVVSYTFYLNPQTIELTLPSRGKWQAPAALVLIVVFCIGLLCASFVAILIGIKQKFLAWLASRQANIEATNKKLTIAARESLATKELNQAVSLFERIIALEPGNVIARIMLAKAKQAQDKPRDALKTLDEARQADRQNLELLVLAAELNEQLGNETAAFDNLAIALRAQPTNKTVLKNIIRLASSLRREEEALAFLEKLMKLSPSAQQHELVNQKATLEFKIILQKFSDKALLKLELIELEKRYKDFAPLLTMLARFEEDDDNLDQAIKLYTRAYKSAGDVETLNLMAHACLRQDNPDKAISVVRAALSLVEQNSCSALDGQLFLASLLIHLGVHDQALAVLAASEPRLETITQKATAKVLHSLTSKNRGQLNEAFDQLYAALGDTEVGDGINRTIFAHGLTDSRHAVNP